MRFSNAQYLEKEVVTVSCRNGDTGAILDGQPVFLLDAVNATNLGTDSVLFSNANAQIGLSAGIAKWYKLAGTSSQLTGAQVGDVFEAVAYGFTDAIITLRTRATSTDSWSTSPAIAIGDQLVPETKGNNLSRSTTLAANQQAPFVAGSSIASQTTGASNATLTGGVTTVTADTIRMKVFVRLM